MKLWSLSLRGGSTIPEALAFAAADPAHHVRWAGNRNPHLAWSEVPAGTESLALFCLDGDAPLDAADANQPGRELAPGLPRGDFYHWSLLDIPPGVGAIGEGAASDGVTPRGKPGPLAVLSDAPGLVLRHGLNDYTAWFANDPAMAGDYHGYDGPCPPWNDLRVHHYIFRIYALDVARLELPARFSGAQAMAALQGHIIDEAQLIATYTLNPALAGP